jgi:hypothetical protein
MATMDRVTYPLGIHVVTTIGTDPEPMAIYRTDEMDKARAGLAELSRSGIVGRTVGYSLRNRSGRQIQYAAFRYATDFEFKEDNAFHYGTFHGSYVGSRWKVVDRCKFNNYGTRTFRSRSDAEDWATRTHEFKIGRRARI